MKLRTLLLKFKLAARNNLLSLAAASAITLTLNLVPKIDIRETIDGYKQTWREYERKQQELERRRKHVAKAIAEKSQQRCADNANSFADYFIGHFPYLNDEQLTALEKYNVVFCEDSRFSAASLREGKLGSIYRTPDSVVVGFLPERPHLTFAPQIAEAYQNKNPLAPSKILPELVMFVAKSLTWLPAEGVQGLTVTMTSGGQSGDPYVSGIRSDPAVALPLYRTNLELARPPLKPSP